MKEMEKCKVVLAMRISNNLWSVVSLVICRNAPYISHNRVCESVFMGTHTFGQC